MADTQRDQESEEKLMPVSWKPSTTEAHEALPKKTAAPKDPGWEEVMQELERGNIVMIEYHDPKERATLARSIGRRAAHRGFRVDQRDGGGYVSVRMVEPDMGKPARGRRARASA